MSCPFGYTSEETDGGGMAAAAGCPAHGGAGAATIESSGEGKASPTYGSYLQVEELLKCQTPLSIDPETGGPAHDELLFIVIHQTYELWFKLIIHELDWVRNVFMDEVEEADMLRVVRQLTRIVEILKVAAAQILVLTTLTPLDFLSFRNFLGTSSGFQSVQFRVIENKLGLKRANRIKYQKVDYTAQLTPEETITVEKAETEPTLHDLIDGWLTRTPGLDTDWFERFEQGIRDDIAKDRTVAEAIGDEVERTAAVADVDNTEKVYNSFFNEDEHNKLVASKARSFTHKASKGALMIFLLRDQPRFHIPFNMLQLLQDIDATLMSWRHNHTIVVQRVIGSKPGSGGSSGYQYLRSTVSDRYKIYKDLNNLATFVVPRELIPDLSEAHYVRLNTYNSPTRPPRGSPMKGSPATTATHSPASSSPPTTAAKE